MSVGESSYPPDVHVLRDLRFWTVRDASGTRSHLEVTPHLCGPTGTLRAGALATLADMAGGEGAIRAVRPDWVATSDLVLHVTAPVREGVVVACPQVLRRTRSTVVLEVTLSVSEPERGEQEIGFTTLTFAVLSAREGAQRMGTGAEEPRTDFALPGSGLQAPIPEILERRIVDAAAGVVEVPITPYVGNSLGALQGGVVAMLIELAAEAAGEALLGRPVAVLDLAVNYLRLVRAGPARTRVRLLRRERDEALLHVVVQDVGGDGALCTVATVLVRA